MRTAPAGRTMALCHVGIADLLERTGSDAGREVLEEQAMINAFAVESEARHKQNDAMHEAARVRFILSARAAAPTTRGPVGVPVQTSHRGWIAGFRGITRAAGARAR
jgi:hypothetical protein